jgi:hypothetical protein
MSNLRRNPGKKKEKEEEKKALVLCRNRKEFWTMQTQFWPWIRESVITKTGYQSLTSCFNENAKS